jgi:hypothetical protein
MGLIGGALAVLAFVIAGHFLGDGDSANSASLGQDGGVHDGGDELDGGLPDDASPIIADAAAKKPRAHKRNKRRRGKGKKARARNKRKNLRKKR